MSAEAINLNAVLGDTSVDTSVSCSLGSQCLGSERAVIATGTKLLICVEHPFFFLSMISYVKTKCQWVSSSGNVF